MTKNQIVKKMLEGFEERQKRRANRRAFWNKHVKRLAPFYRRGVKPPMSLYKKGPHDI